MTAVRRFLIVAAALAAVAGCGPTNTCRTVVVPATYPTCDVSGVCWSGRTTVPVKVCDE